MEAKYIQHAGDDLLVVNAARVSMGKQSEWEISEVPKEDENGLYWENVLSAKDAKLINYLAKHQHMTPFEHCTVTLHLKVPLFICAQIQRHRTFAFNQISRRYVDDQIEFYYPDKWRKRAENVKQGSSDEEVKELKVTDCVESYTTEVANAYQLACSAAESLYNDMLKAGVAPELARMILPQSLYTEFFATANLRNWAHFLKLRLDSHAQAEVREIAQQCADIIKSLYPVSYAALMEN